MNSDCGAVWPHDFNRMRNIHNGVAKTADQQILQSMLFGKSFRFFVFKGNSVSVAQIKAE